MQECTVSWSIWSLQRSGVCPNQASLVVESEWDEKQTLRILAIIFSPLIAQFCVQFDWTVAKSHRILGPPTGRRFLLVFRCADLPWENGEEKRRVNTAQSPHFLAFLLYALFHRLCPECLFYTLGNLDDSGRQFDKLGDKVRGNLFKFNGMHASVIGLHCLLAHTLQSGHDDFAYTMVPTCEIYWRILHYWRLQLGLVTCLLGTAVFQLSPCHVVECLTSGSYGIVVNHTFSHSLSISIWTCRVTV